MSKKTENKQLEYYSIVKHYKSGLTVKECVDTVSDYIKLLDITYNVLDYMMQLEEGEDSKNGINQHYHLQVYLKLVRIRFRTAENRAKKNKEIGFLKICSTAGIAALKTYCMKQETKVGGPWCKYPDRVINLNIPDYKDFTYYQKKTTAYAIKSMNNPHDRKIIWIWCRKGFSGKTAVLKYLYKYYKAAYIPGYTDSRTLSLIMNAPTYKFSKLLCINLPKEKPKDNTIKDILSVLEGVKDNFIMNTKGCNDIGVTEINNKTILISANYPPPIWRKETLFIIKFFPLPKPQRIIDQDKLLYDMLGDIEWDGIDSENESDEEDFKVFTDRLDGIEQTIDEGFNLKV